MTYILIIMLFTQPSHRGASSPAVSSIDGFGSRAACVAAATEVHNTVQRKMWTYTGNPVARTVCVKAGV